MSSLVNYSLWALVAHVRRFELDYILAALPKPYVAILDGITSASHINSISACLSTEH